MKKHLVERVIPGVDQMSPEAYQGLAARSNAVLARLAPRMQWVESSVAKDLADCVYIADDKGVILEHARLNRFPATKITDVVRQIDPMTAEG